MTPLVVARAGLLGVVAGLRSAMPAAALAGSGLRPTGRLLSVLGSGGSRSAAYLAVAGELIADKLPRTPSRTDRGPLVVRIASGATAGAVLASATGVRGARLALPVLAGAGGAYLGSWGGFTARRALGAATGLPDPVVAVAEDVVAIGLAAVAVKGT